MPLSLLGVFLLGTLLGAAANWAAYRFAWTPRPISPWSPAPPPAPPRTFRDRIPIIGWLAMRKLQPIHGPHFWVRPMLVELLMGIGLAALYWWEVEQHGLIAGQLVELPAAPRVAGPVAIPAGPLHAAFAAHAILVTLMMAATLVDLDELMIPDAITVYGALLGIALVTIFPMALLPHVAERGGPLSACVDLGIPPGFLMNPGDQVYIEPVTATAPNPWPPKILAARSFEGLICILACFGLWLVALTPRTWRGRRGMRRAATILFARITRELCRPPLAVIGLAGMVAIVATWQIGGPHWLGLSTALVGLVGSGALVWATRIAGSHALGVEAMGFGDVTLMMMVGTFIGWQAGIIVFFVAPFAGIVAGITQLALRRGKVIPYGPYLCLGTLAVIIGWARVWVVVQETFSFGAMIAAMLAIVMILLWAMLAVLSMIRGDRGR